MTKSECQDCIYFLTSAGCGNDLPEFRLPMFLSVSRTSSFLRPLSRSIFRFISSVPGLELTSEGIRAQHQNPAIISGVSLLSARLILVTIIRISWSSEHRFQRSEPVYRGGSTIVLLLVDYRPLAVLRKRKRHTHQLVFRQ